MQVESASEIINVENIKVLPIPLVTVISSSNITFIIAIIIIRAIIHPKCSSLTCSTHWTVSRCDRSWRTSKS